MNWNEDRLLTLLMDIGKARAEVEQAKQLVREAQVNERATKREAVKELVEMKAYDFLKVDTEEVRLYIRSQQSGSKARRQG